MVIWYIKTYTCTNVIYLFFNFGSERFRYSFIIQLILLYKTKGVKRRFGILKKKSTSTQRFLKLNCPNASNINSDRSRTIFFFFFNTFTFYTPNKH